MEGEGNCGAVVVELEDAVKLLVEHLVLPALPRGTLRRQEALALENQETVARQMHATVLLYNYYHRKQFPQLEFADPVRFCMTASLTAGDALLVYLQQVHDHGVGGGLSVTDKAVVDACDIAEALDATKDSPEITMWPISRVAVLLLDQTKRKCLVEHGSETKGVLSFLEKDITALDGSRGNDVSVQESSNKSIALPSEPYVLQQIAYSEVELKTGIKRANLRFLEEHRVYSLSKKGTATMLFVLQYGQTGNGKLKEMPLEVLINRMSGPIFRSDPCLATTYVVECYHLLPYKEVLLNVLNREWPLDSSLSAPKERLFQNENPSPHSEIDESLKEQEANSKSKMKKNTTNVSTPKKNKQLVKAVGDSGTSKNKKSSNANSKRKSETFRDTLPPYPEHGDGESPTKETDSLAARDVGSVKPTKSTNGGSVDLQDKVQMDKDGTEKHAKSRNIPQDIFSAPDVSPVIKNHDLESQKEKDTEKSGKDNPIQDKKLVVPVIDHFHIDAPKLNLYTSKCNLGGITGNMNVQKFATLQLLQKMRDDTLREHCMLGDRSAQYEMEIQTILTDCIPIFADMYQASVYLSGPDFNLSADSDRKITPHEARDSAASNMLHQLQQKAQEN
ncbi:hypothetical protein BAE44_0009690 [Dichanthelium oligosanthes]|uniref:Uncharacterized protein n=1 Tax=Dichanthelium oligosanthes TaxID=888268 RepID=A0A1E5VW40_9POAL|nr:hypothetical protein BAE44_0009690 [Dichanthelium oligosanthes]